VLEELCRGLLDRGHADLLRGRNLGPKVRPVRFLHIRGDADRRCTELRIERDNPWIHEPEEPR